MLPCFRSCVRKLTPVFAVVSQNVTKRSFWVWVKSEKYALWVTLRPLGSIRQGEPEIHALQYCAPSCVNQTYFSVSSLPQCWSQAVVCVNTPRMYPWSGYFLVFINHIFSLGTCDGGIFTYEKTTGHFLRTAREDPLVLDNRAPGITVDCANACSSIGKLAFNSNFHH